MEDVNIIISIFYYLFILFFYIVRKVAIFFFNFRYLVSSPEMPFFYKHELDAFLVQAVDPHMMDTEHTQKLEVLKILLYFTEKCYSFLLL